MISSMLKASSSGESPGLWEGKILSGFNGTSPLGGSESHAAGSHTKDGESRGVLRVEAEGVWPELRFHPMELDGI